MSAPGIFGLLEEIEYLSQDAACKTAKSDMGIPISEQHQSVRRSITRSSPRRKLDIHSLRFWLGQYEMARTRAAHGGAAETSELHFAALNLRRIFADRDIDIALDGERPWHPSRGV